MGRLAPTLRSKVKEKEDLLENLPPRHVAFLKEYMENGYHPMEAYMKVYRMKNKAVASSNAYRILKKLENVRKALFEQSGFGEAEIIDIVKNASKATRTLFYNRQRFDIPDHYARIKAGQFYLEATEKLEQEKQKPVNQMNVQIIMDKKQGVKVIQHEEEN